MRCIKLSPFITAITIYALVALSGSFSTASAQVTYGFNGITNNNPGDVTIAESQLFVDVFDRSGLAVFRFFNTGPEASTIGQIYFDGVTGLSNPFLTSASGVAFSVGDMSGPNPPVLPGGNSIAPKFVVEQWFKANNPAPHNGINPGEELYIAFNYDGNISAIENAIFDGNLRLGIHVQSFASGGSESLITKGGTNVVPEPCSVLLSVIGMGVVGALKRRRAL